MSLSKHVVGTMVGMFKRASTILPGWCAWAATVPWQKFATLWFCEPNWTPALPTFPSGRRFRWASSRQVRDPPRPPSRILVVVPPNDFGWGARVSSCAFHRFHGRGFLFRSRSAGSRHGRHARHPGYRHPRRSRRPLSSTRCCSLARSFASDFWSGPASRSCSPA